ncbi:DSBA-like thioredoxin domain [Seminavis robusta]|uniref:DSBA-like thioredoxin domain n=1 Tax=Seminavis robusta TaxID=568900 RepID=A0A9N8E5T7_9STRA|nr:DSBA-like thioredoxin domain [Seminavis robusta]|eukprot:Sro701_g189830.1 DSBA-like thioredoxin domain (217) ;mRNA; r:38157-38807
MNPKALVHVTMTSDLMCPWCWVGLRKLQEAAKNTNIEAVVEWKPFLLRPNHPEEGVLKTDPTPASRVGRHLKMAGQSVGIDFTGLTDRTPNTTLFHAVMKYLQDDLKMSPKDATAYHEAVFEGYFTLGEFPDQKGLLKAASRVPNHSESLTKCIAGLFQDSQKLVALKDDVRKEAYEASRRGISGVPSFAVNGKTLFSGAQPVEVFEEVLTRFAHQ